MSDISDIASPKISTWPSLIKIFRTSIVMKGVSGKFQSWLKACLLHYYHLTVPLAHVRNLEWPQGLSDMLAHVRDLNPLPFINQPWLMCRKCLISTKKNLTHLSSGCSTQHPKKCFSDEQSDQHHLGCSTVKTCLWYSLILGCWSTRVYCGI